MSDHFTSSDDDLEEMLEVMEVPKNRNYFEEIVPQMDDAEFVEHFRVSRGVMVQLAEQFRASEHYHYQEGNSEKISPSKFITVFLWFAANEASSYRDVADRFNVTKSSLHKIISMIFFAFPWLIDLT
ncbi:hypothetical protein QE152_g35297 [Popillia japonica]|uniref:Transposase Helix-turn-helix domain-containing protein n=1 Tax=Popillia japonica TaxID=7064 RepID=A0AAW1IG45_POPJA